MKRIVELIRRRWFGVTVALLCALLVTQVVPILHQGSQAAVTEWGLGFGEDGEQPRGNASAEYLAQYDAYYVGSPQEKVIYLTFDAGYENGNTAPILDVLKKNNVPAAFFVVGTYIREQPELIKRMAQEGHIVGNHTDAHKDMRNITSEKEFLEALQPVEQAYTQATGEQMPKFYRPPEGKFSESNLEMAKKLGYKTVFWSLAYKDWLVKDQPTEAYAIGKLCPRMHNGCILLLHSTSSTNAQILDGLINRWKQEGYTFKSLNDLPATGAKA